MTITHGLETCTLPLQALGMRLIVQLCTSLNHILIFHPQRSYLCRKNACHSSKFIPNIVKTNRRNFNHPEIFQFTNITSVLHGIYSYISLIKRIKTNVKNQQLAYAATVQVYLN
ncbi:hypothetical protein CDL12_09572 [Handroanthus impetiginosus]|uniref:Uncharacterized protein n=1 Tax=Handroanthus impetiginosus TaxID=429701 RepID=A0A2G9HJU8_9LAMI|nr:hypothetical protein CDL12_09572 [Handroanthus impetiginosus]